MYARPPQRNGGSPIGNLFHGLHLGPARLEGAVDGGGHETCTLPLSSPLVTSRGQVAPLSVMPEMMSMVWSQLYNSIRYLLRGAKRNVPMPEPHTARPARGTDHSTPRGRRLKGKAGTRGESPPAAEVEADDDDGGQVHQAKADPCKSTAPFCTIYHKPSSISLFQSSKC